MADDEAKKIADACTYDAIDLDAAETTETLEVGAVVVATGWHPYPLEKLDELGGGRFDDVIANVQMERLASPAGPTGGKILRPSNGEPPKKVAFVQCAGSRDVNHLTYCSGVCCLASLKQAHLRQGAAARGRGDDVLHRPPHPGPQRGRAPQGRRDRGRQPGQGQGRPDRAGQRLRLKLHVEDVENDTLIEAEADLVVLATGMVPNAGDDDLAVFTRKDDDGFVLDDLESGVTVAGVARRPEDVAASVRDATGAAARALDRCGKEGVMDKLGVFLCTGCGIGDAVDVDEVIEAADENGCAATLTHECLCAPEGLEAIRASVTENEPRRRPPRRLLGARQDRGVRASDRRRSRSMFRTACASTAPGPTRREGRGRRRHDACSPRTWCGWVWPVSTA